MEKREKLSNFSEDKSRVKRIQGEQTQQIQPGGARHMWTGLRGDRLLGDVSWTKKWEVFGKSEEGTCTGQGAKGKTDWGRRGVSVWWGQTENLCSHPFLFTHWNVIQDAETCSSSVRKQSNAKCFRQKGSGCTQGCTASEFGLAVHKARYQWGFHTKFSLQSEIAH